MAWLCNSVDCKIFAIDYVCSQSGGTSLSILFISLPVHTYATWTTSWLRDKFLCRGLRYLPNQRV